MPLIKSGSDKAKSQNIREMMAAGYPQRQAIAAAMDTARRYGKKYADGGEIDPMQPQMGSPEDYYVPANEPPNKTRRILTALGEGAKQMIDKPGRKLWGEDVIQPEVSGQVTEGDVFRQDMMSKADANWAAGNALGMVGMGRLPGAAPEGAVVGSGGSRMIQPQPKVGSPEFNASLLDNMAGALGVEGKPPPQLNHQLEQLYAHNAQITAGKEEAAAKAKQYAEWMPEPALDYKAFANSILDDLVGGETPNAVAKSLFGLVKSGDIPIEMAMAAKDSLPKIVKSDINKALWGLTKSKKMSAEDKEIINNLYSSKAKAKKTPVANPERGATHGTTPDEIEEFMNNMDKAGIGPQWEPPEIKIKHPSAKSGDPEIGLVNELFLRHDSPFPERIPITPEKEALAKQWWGETQQGWHASPAGWENWKGKTLLLPEEVPHKDQFGNTYYNPPELGIHLGTNHAAHTRIGPYNPQTWTDFTDSFGNPHVIPLVMKHERPLDLPDLGQWVADKVAEALRRRTTIPHEEITEAMSNKLPAGSQERQTTQMNNLRALLDSHGYDSVRYINQHEDPGSVSFITWHKKNLRNAWAEFKDKEAESLTAGIAGGSVLYPYYRNSPTNDEGNGMKGGGRTKMAGGGFNPNKWIPRPSIGASVRPVGGGLAQARIPKPSGSGFIKSSIPGRTDKIPMGVKGGSYIIPASVVSGMGQGNSLAGGAALDKLFGQTPGGGKLRSFSTPKANYGKAMRMATPKIRAEGGETGEDEALVPIIVAGGEYRVPPEVVRRIGNGDMKHGHNVLDELVKTIRRQTITDMKNEKPPKR